MRRTAMLLATTLCAACAQTPLEVKQSGTQHAATLAQAPEQAAYCIERNAENAHATNMANHRPLQDGSGLEVVIRFTGEATGTLAVAQLRRAGSGTAATMWITSNVLGDSSAIATKFLEGC